MCRVRVVWVRVRVCGCVGFGVSCVAAEGRRVVVLALPSAKVKRKLEPASAKEVRRVWAGKPVV
jgi:hypothetical protein